MGFCFYEHSEEDINMKVMEETMCIDRFNCI